MRLKDAFLIVAVIIGLGIASYILPKIGKKGTVGDGFGILGSQTFGYETPGTAGSTGTCGKIVGSKFTISEDGTADNMTAYLQRVGSPVVACAIYNHSNSVLIGSTAWRTLSAGTGWETFLFSAPKPSLVSGTEYVLVAWSYCTQFPIELSMLYYDAGSSNQGHYQSKDPYTWPDPASFSNNDNKYSIYCEYTVSATTTTTTTSTTTSSTTTTIPIDCEFNMTHNTSLNCSWYCNFTGSNKTKFLIIYGGPGWVNFTDFDLNYTGFKFNATDCFVNITPPCFWNLTPS